jgi:hypothetical protein
MLLTLISLATARCLSVQDTLDEAEEHLLYAQWDEANSVLAKVPEAFSCAALYPDQLGRYWMLMGAAQQLSGHTEAATPYYASARRLIPEAESQLGTEVAAAYLAAMVTGEGQISLDPGTTAWVDGRINETWPLVLPAGPHLLQVRTIDDRVLYGTGVDLADHQTAMLQSGLPAEVDLNKRKLKFPTYLVSGVLLAAGGGVMAWGATQQDPIITSTYDACVKNPSNCDEKGFRAAGTNGNLLSIGAYTLWTAGAAGITAQFVIPVMKKNQDAPPETPADPPPAQGTN